MCEFKCVDCIEMLLVGDDKDDVWVFGGYVFFYGICDKDEICICGDWWV